MELHGINHVMDTTALNFCVIELVASCRCAIEAQFIRDSHFFDLNKLER